MFCKLSSAEMREHLGVLRVKFLTQVIAVDELESGYRYSIAKSPEHLAMLAEFVEFESGCCGFLDFEIALLGGEERVSLTLSGPPGTKKFLETMMSSVSFDWKAGT